MNRRQFQHAGLTLSYLDAGGDGRVLIALHAHWMKGLTFAPTFNFGGEINTETVKL